MQDFSYKSVQSRAIQNQNQMPYQQNQMASPQNQMPYQQNQMTSPQNSMSSQQNLMTSPQNYQRQQQQITQHHQQISHQQQITHHQQTLHHQYQTHNTRVTHTQTAVPHIHQYDIHPKQIQLPQQNFNVIPTEQQIIQNTQVNIDFLHPMMRETYQIDRDLQVISVEDVEEPWKRKCVQLEVRIYDLETDLSRFKNMGLTDQVNSDENRIIELEARNRKLIQNEMELREEISKMNDELDDWRQRYQTIQKEFQDSLGDTEILRQLKTTISDRDVVITKLEQEINRRDKKNEELMMTIKKKNDELDDLNQQLNDMEQEFAQFSESQTQVTYLTSELDTWKKKFRDLNTEFHHCQEQLMLSQAELESLKNQKVIITTETRKSTHQQNRPQVGVSQYKQ